MQNQRKSHSRHCRHCTDLQLSRPQALAHRLDREKAKATLPALPLGLLATDLPSPIHLSVWAGDLQDSGESCQSQSVGAEGGLHPLVAHSLQELDPFASRGTMETKHSGHSLRNCTTDNLRQLPTRHGCEGVGRRAGCGRLGLGAHYGHCGLVSVWAPRVSALWSPCASG